MKAIIAVSQNNAIGTETGLPWRCSLDLKWFKSYTENSTVLMGRKTMETLGKPLPNRENLVLSKTLSAGDHDGFTVINCPSQLPEQTNDIIIVGGAEIYKLFKRDIKELMVSTIDEWPSDATVFIDIGELSKGMVLETHLRKETKAFNQVFAKLVKKRADLKTTNLYSVKKFVR